jgi:hypothetical protein
VFTKTLKLTPEVEVEVALKTNVLVIAANKSFDLVQTNRDFVKLISNLYQQRQSLH